MKLLSRLKRLEALVELIFARASASPASTQTTWFIDPVNGSDNNSGLTAQTALKTWAQYLVRTGYEQDFDGLSVDVTILNDLPATDPVKKRARANAEIAGSHFGIHGTQTIQLSANMTSFTPSTQATNTRASFTVASGLTAAMVGMLVFFPNSSAWSVITTVSGQTATCLDPTTAPANTLISTIPVIGATDPIQVISTTQCHLALDFIVVATTGTYTGGPIGPFLVENLKERSQVTFVRSSGFTASPIVIQFCQFADLDFECTGVFLRNSSVNMLVQTSLRCQYDLSTGMGTQGVAFIAPAPTFGLATMIATGVEFGAFNASNAVNEFSGALQFQCAVFNVTFGRVGLWFSGSSGAGISVFNGELQVSRGSFFGVSSTTTFAMKMGKGGRFNYFTGGGGWTFFATAVTDQFTWRVGNSVWPQVAANGTIGAQAACTNWTTLQGGTFNGFAYDYAFTSSIGQI